MGNEHRITKKGPLHNDDGTLAECGWSNEMLLSYDRARVKAKSWRIKEWDYYLVNDGDYAVAVTVGDMWYAGLISASLVDFKNQSYKTTSVTALMPRGKLNMPSRSDAGVTSYENKNVSFWFRVLDGKRYLSVRFAKFDGEEDLEFDAVLSDEPRDSMVISTPWSDDPQAFYYNQKIVAMRAEGSFRKGGLTHEFNPEASFGLLDWGRGVWTRDNTWYWGAAQGVQKGPDGQDHVVGLNIGYGFGDTSAASENMFFLDGIAHKLHRLDFGIPESEEAASAKTIADRYDLLKPWSMRDDEGRFTVTFTPILDRIDWMDYKLILSDQHQVFGRYDGDVTLDDGTVFRLDGLLGFAEAVHNIY